MNRRNMLKALGGGNAALLAGSMPISPVLGQSELASVKIKDIKVILSSPAGGTLRHHEGLYRPARVIRGRVRELPGTPARGRGFH